MERWEPMEKRSVINDSVPFSICNFKSYTSHFCSKRHRKKPRKDIASLHSHRIEENRTKIMEENALK